MRMETKFDNQKFMGKGKRIYKRLKISIEKRFRGKVIALDVESGKYVVGENELAAAMKARQKFPDKIFAFFKVGFPAVHKFRRQQK